MLLAQLLSSSWRLPAAVVSMSVMGLGGDHDPAHGMGRIGDQVADPAAEVAGVAKNRCVEAVQEQAGDEVGAGVWSTSLKP